MKTIIILSLLVAVCFLGYAQELPYQVVKKDMSALGMGTIITEDRSVIKNITLHEIKEYWIVYIKNGSLHDLMMDKIIRIEFLHSKWGNVNVEFPENKPTFLIVDQQQN